jgi:Proliferating cell nuclear antigen, N-terminal domain.
MSQLFSIDIENGHLFKHLIDFISLCVFPVNKCWLRFDNEGLKMQYVTEKQNDVQCFMSLILERDNFQSFHVVKQIELQVEPKQIQKLCRNIRKKDHLYLSFISDNTNVRFLLHIRSSYNSLEKEEIKEIPFISFFEKQEQLLDKDLGFCPIPFTLDTSEIQNLKKAVGVKKESVEIQLSENNFLKFTTLSHGISPIVIKYGKEKICTTKINLSGHIVNILSKLGNLSKSVRFYEKETKSTEYQMIKISSVIDIPKYLGKVEMYVYENGKN